MSTSLLHRKLATAKTEQQTVYLDELLQTSGMEAGTALVPHIGIGIEIFNWEETTNLFEVKGVVKSRSSDQNFALSIAQTNGLKIDLYCQSAGEKGILLGELFEPLFTQLLQPFLPESFYYNLYDSNISTFQFQLDSAQRSFYLYGKADLLQFSGQLWLTILPVMDARKVLFRIQLDQGPLSIPDLLTGTLGLTIPENVKKYIPTFKFGIKDITFDQFNQSFQLNGELLYKNIHLLGALEVNWNNEGLESIRVLIATQEDDPLLLDELARSLPFPIDSLRSSISTKVADRIGQTTFHSLDIFVDISKKSLHLEGKANLFGKLYIEGDFKISLQSGFPVLAFHCETKEAPFVQLEDVLNWIGLDTSLLSDKLPPLGVAINVIHFDQAEKVFQLKGQIDGVQDRANLELQVQVHEGLAVQFTANATPGRGITLEDILPATVFDSIQKLSLPEKFVNNLKASGLWSLQTELDTSIPAFSFYAAGRVMGLEGEVLCNVFPVMGTPVIVFQLRSEQEAKPVTEWLAGSFGIQLSGSVQQYLAGISLALRELSFDQADGHFSFKGVLKTPHYSCMGSIQVNWGNGKLQEVQLSVEAEEKTITFAAILQDLPFNLQGVVDVMPKAIGQSGFNYLDCHIDITNRYLEMNGRVNLFGLAMVNASGAVFLQNKQPVIQLQAHVEEGTPQLKDLLIAMGLNVNAVGDWLPDIDIALKYVSFDQLSKNMAIGCQVFVGSSEIDLDLHVLLTQNNHALIKFSAIATPDLRLSTFLKATLPAINLDEIPVLNQLDISLQDVTLTIDTENKRLFGESSGSVIISGTSINLALERHEEAEAGWEFTAQSAPGEVIDIQPLMKDLLETAKISLPTSFPALSFANLYFNCKTATRSVAFRGTASMTQSLQLGNLELALTLGINASYNPQTKLTGKFMGALQLGNTTFSAAYLIDKTHQLTLQTQPLLTGGEGEQKPTDLRELLTSVLGKDITLPEGLPDMQLKDAGGNINLSTKEIDLHGTASIKWDFLQNGSDLECTVGLKFKRTLAKAPKASDQELSTEEKIKAEKGQVETDADGNNYEIYCQLDVSTTGQFKVTPDLSMDNIEFHFLYDNGNWGLAGGLRAQFLDKTFTIAAKYAKTKQARVLHLEGKGTSESHLLQVGQFAINHVGFDLTVSSLVAQKQAAAKSETAPVQYQQRSITGSIHGQLNFGSTTATMRAELKDNLSFSAQLPKVNFAAVSTDLFDLIPPKELPDIQFKDVNINLTLSNQLLSYTDAQGKTHTAKQKIANPKAIELTLNGQLQIGEKHDKVIEFKNISLGIDNAKNLLVTGNLSLQKAANDNNAPGINLGASTLPLAQLDLALHRFNETTTAAFTLSGTPKIDLLPSIHCNSYAFALAYNHGDWALSGETKLTVFDRNVDFSARYESNTKGEKAVWLKASMKGDPVYLLPDLVALNLKGFELHVAKKPAQAGQKASYEWALAANGIDFTAYSLLDKKKVIHLEGGSMSLYRKADKTGFLFTAQTARFKPLAVFDLPKELKDLITIGLGSITIEKDNQKGNWGITATVEAVIEDSLANSPLFQATHELLDKLFPKVDGNQRKLEGSLSIQSDGISFSINNTNGIVIPDLFEKLEVSQALHLPTIGSSYLLLKNLSISISKQLSFTATVAVALPSKLNEAIFKDELEPLHGVIRTYKGKRTTESDFLTATLDISTAGISGRLEGNPFDFTAPEKLSKKLKQQLDAGIKDAKDHILIDFDQLVANVDKQGVPLTPGLGMIKVEKPMLKLDLQKGAFKFSGGYEIDEARGLSIPTGLLRTLIVMVMEKAFHKKDSGKLLTKVIPDSIPVKSVDLVVTRNGKRQLNTDGLEAVFQSLNDGFKFPDPIKKILGLANEAIDRLPERFTDYFSIKIPRAVHVDIDITPDGGVNFVLSTKGDPLQLLLPNMPYCQNIIGIRLRMVSFGVLLGGALARLDISMEYDDFDLLSLGTSLLVKGKMRDLLPNDPKTFCRTVKIDKLVTIIIYQTGIPIPVPLFYDELAFQHIGLEGLIINTSIKLPFPNINFGKALPLIQQAKSFFTQKEGVLQLSQYPLQDGQPTEGTALNLSFTAGPISVQLPNYLAQEQKSNRGAYDQPVVIGLTGNYTLNGQDAIFLMANFLKAGILRTVVGTPYSANYKGEAKRPLNYLVQYLPADIRMGTKDIQLLKVFQIKTAWAISTPNEFKEEVYPKLLALYNKDNPTIPASPADELMELFHEPDTPGGEMESNSGLVLFFRGNLNLADAIKLEAAFGVSASMGTGFRMGASFSGQVHRMVDMRLLGYFKVDPASKTEVFRLLGKAQLRIFEQKVLDGLFDLSIKKPADESEFQFHGILKLFPEGFPLQLTGALAGRVNQQGFLLEGGALLQLGQLKAMAYLFIRAGKLKPGKAAKDLPVPINESLRTALYDEEGEQFFLSAKFLMSSLLLQVTQRSDANRYQLAAKAQFTLLKLLHFTGDLNLELNTGRSLSFTGRSQLILGPTDRPIVKIGTWANALIDKQAGHLALDAQISEDSFILFPNCKPTGGIAFYSWFAGEHAGDFVLSVGGYHPRFQKPSHYPDVPRLGINWSIDDNTRIIGDAYFAMTPSGIMAGGQWDLSWRYGPFSAWLRTQVDLLMMWHPLQYDAHLRVSIGAGFTFERINKTISVQVQTELHLWGDTTHFGGKAHVDMHIVSFDVRFGHDHPGRAATLDWKAFLEKFLLEKEQSPQDLTEVQITDGLLLQKQATDRKSDDIEMVSPGNLALRIVSSIPAKSAWIGSKEYKDASFNTAFGIAPMGIHRSEFSKSELQLTITKDGKDVTQLFDLQPILENLPVAIWGEKPQPGLNDAPLVKNTLVGFTLQPKAPETPKESMPIPIEALQSIDQNKKKITPSANPDSKKVATPTKKVTEQAIQPKANKQRLKLVEAMGFDPAEIKLDSFSQAPENVFAAEPETWE